MQTSAPVSMRLLLVDDHAVVRDGLRRLLAEEDQLEVVGEAGDSPGAIAETLRLRPDVVVFEMALVDGKGLSAIQQITRECPTAKVVVLTRSEEADAPLAAITAGAYGFISKRESAAEVVAQLRGLALGEAAFSREVMGQVLRAVRTGTCRKAAEPSLTPRERQLLQLLVDHASNDEIAATLGISKFTVKAHVSHIFAKLHVQSRKEAVEYGIARGWLKPPRTDLRVTPGAPARRGGGRPPIPSRGAA